MRTNLHHLLKEGADSHSESLAITFKRQTLSYGELWQLCAGFAQGLRNMGLQRSERVAIFLDKRIETVAAIFGVSAAGGAFVPINPLLRPHQVGYILRDCGARVLVTSP